MLQPKIAGQLRDGKVANIESMQPELISAGNTGYMTQISRGTQLLVVHTADLLDWATGGPKPCALPG